MTKWDHANRLKKMRREAGRGWIDSSLRRADKSVSKAEMQRQLAEAVRNTAKLPVDNAHAARGPEK
jgi:hypothetical protein